MPTQFTAQVRDANIGSGPEPLQVLDSSGSQLQIGQIEKEVNIDELSKIPLNTFSGIYEPDYSGVDNLKAIIFNGDYSLDRLSGGVRCGLSEGSCSDEISSNFEIRSDITDMTRESDTSFESNGDNLLHFCRITK